MTIEKDHLHTLEAQELLAHFRSEELSPVEVMEAILDRAATVEPSINAFCQTFPEEAMECAKEAERRYEEGSARPLEGLALAVKEDTPVKGQVWAEGSLLTKDRVAEGTAPSIGRLEAAGAIIHARTTCPEFCWAWTCYSRLHGVTRNPWDLAMTPGGSSGGSAAALAAGSAVLASGTDSAGSIRQPAALCGLVGYKPPYGRNPQAPSASFDFYNHIGPMARSVEDLRLMQSVMAGQHPMDHVSLPNPPTLPSAPEDVTGLKIAASLDLGFYTVDPGVKREMIACLQALEEAGAVIEWVETPWAEAAVEASHAFGAVIHGKLFQEAIETQKDLLCDYSLSFAEDVAGYEPADLHHALTFAGEVWAQHLGPLFDDFDAFCCPTVAVPEIPAEQKPWDRSILCEGVALQDYECTMTPLFNMFSRCPVLALPSGMTDSSLPTSLQLVARPYDDAMVFRIAQALEALRPWSHRKPPLRSL